MIGYRKNYWGTITKRYGQVVAVPNTPGRNKGDPVQIRYDAVADELSADPATGLSLKLVNHLPNSRIANGGKIVVAEPGHPCIIQIRDGHVYLWPITEGIPFLEACP